MKKRIKYAILLSAFIGLIVIISSTILKAKEEKERELAFDKNKIDKKEIYSIKRVNNKYTIKSDKLKNKKLENIFYDDTNVYLYYDGEEKATLLKYNIEKGKVIILYEESEELHGGMTKIGSYYKLGNKIFNSKFKKTMDYPDIKDNELIFPSLDKVLYKTDTGISVKDLKTKEDKEIITNKENEIYDVYSIKNDGKYILISKTTDSKKEIVVLNNKYKIINSYLIENIKNKEENNDKNKIKTYSLLDDVPYLLEKTEEEDKKDYKIYNANNKELIYKSSKDKYKNYIFNNTKFICNDESDDIKLVDYVTKEEKILLNKKKNIVQNFILASDNYSLVMHFLNENFTFYIFYL